jgi:hypothetical protein
MPPLGELDIRAGFRTWDPHNNQHYVIHVLTFLKK